MLGVAGSPRGVCSVWVPPPAHPWERSERVCPQGPELPGLALVLPGVPVDVRWDHVRASFHLFP